MAQPRLLLHNRLKAIPGVKDAYFQAPSDMEYPCIKYEIDEDFVAHADNALYWGKNRYTVTVIDRNPDSLIPSWVQALPYSRFDRKYVVDTLHHTVYQLYF